MAVQSTSQPLQEAVLVIKLGALGDFIQAFDAFSDIRARHSGARVTLLTTPPFASLAQRAPWFDEVWTDGRPRWTEILGWGRLVARLRGARFARIYDLQANRRTGFLFRMMGGTPWVGKVAGCAFPDPPFPDTADNCDRLRLRLGGAGVPSAGPADLNWLAADIGRLDPGGRFVLMAPGCSPHLPHKRWPAENFAALGQRLAARGYRVALVGTNADRPAIDALRARFPEAIDLSGKTSLFELASLARSARAVVGNDTGPIFMTAKLGAPTLMLMSSHTNELRSAPRGPAAQWLKRDNLAELGVDEVEAALKLR